MQAISVGCDAHKHYSQLELQDASGQVLNRVRIDHSLGAVSSFFSQLPGGTPVALESVGNWYWIADEIEAAGCLPLLTNPAKAKLMMGHVNKTDKLDANGLATLLRIGSLPTVWLPPAALRDQRELPRTRMALTALRTSIKNRIHSLLAKYDLSPEDGSQLFSKKGRSWLDSSLSRLPPETGRCLAQQIGVARLSFFTNRHPREANPQLDRPHPDDAAPEEPSWRRGHAGHRHRAGGGYYQPLSLSPSVQQLLRHHAAGQFQWR